jgi:hypothetical protein
MKVFVKKTDESIFTPDEERAIEGIPTLEQFEDFEKLGFKHFKPDDGAYTTNYGTLELLKNHKMGNYWNFDWGIGGQIGLMNLNEEGGAVVSELKYPLSSNIVTTTVTFRMSAKYLYYGFSGRFALSRKISQHFSVGCAGGVHVIMGKQSVDMIKPYLSLLAQCSIN